MKRVAVVWSSPNTDGLTASAKDQFARGLSDAGAQVQEIQLNRQSIEHCRACGNGWGTCNKKGTCVIQDDFAGIYQALVEADGIVWISAVYWSDMTECFKAFFDRLRRCDATRNHFLYHLCAGDTGDPRPDASDLRMTTGRRGAPTAIRTGNDVEGPALRRTFWHGQRI